MHRRTFLTIASAGIFVPKYEKWFHRFNPKEIIVTRHISIQEDAFYSNPYSIFKLIDGRQGILINNKPYDMIGQPLLLQERPDGLWEARRGVRV